MTDDPRMRWRSDETANPLDSEYDAWTGDPATDRAAFVARVLEANRRFDVLYGNGRPEELQDEATEESHSSDRPKRRSWLFRRH